MQHTEQELVTNVDQEKTTAHTPISTTDDESTVKLTDDSLGKPLEPNTTFRKNLLRTLTFCLTYLILGVTATSYGPLFIPMSQNLNTSVGNMGLVYTMRGIADIPTSLLTGYCLDRFSLFSEHAVIHDSSNAFVRFILGNLEKIILLTGITSIAVVMFVTPLIKSFWLLMTFNLLQGMGHSMVGVAGNVYLIWMWREDVSPYMQAIHSSFGLGTVVTPLFLQFIDIIFTKTSISEQLPFLTKYNASFFSVALMVLSSGLIVLLTDFTVPKVASSTPVEMDGTEMEETESTTPEQLLPEDPIAEQDDVFNQQNSPRSISKIFGSLNKKSILVTALSGISLCFYVGAEIGYGNVINSYVRLYHPEDFSENMALMLTSVFWFSFTFGRLSSIPIAKFLSIRAMLVVDMVFTILPIIALLISTHKIVIWICTGMIGLAMASQYPATVALPSGHLGVKLSGFSTSVLTMCGTIGAMAIPPLMTAYIKQLMWTLFGAVIFSCVMYIILLFFIKKEPMVTAGTEPLEEEIKS